MLVFLLVLLIVLWGVGVLPINGAIIPNITFFRINGQDVTLWNLIALLAIGWVVGLLPYPFQTIASILLVLWVLSVVGILPLVGLSSLLMLVIIIGLTFYLLQGLFYRHS